MLAIFQTSNSPVLTVAAVQDYGTHGIPTSQEGLNGNLSHELSELVPVVSPLNDGSAVFTSTVTTAPNTPEDKLGGRPPWFNRR